MSKARPNPQKAFAELATISAKKEAAWRGYQDRSLTGDAWKKRDHALEVRRQALRDETRTPFYKDGDFVEKTTGERARVEGWTRGEYGLTYRVVRGIDRGEEIHDLWPAEVIVKKVKSIPKRKIITLGSGKRVWA